ncbi:MAG TPA: hypothetical protein VN519_08200 [Bryobacteraceae bacterium]|nr:hypothetical protein [Bryobacteraceae bacterium]
MQIFSHRVNTAAHLASVPPCYGVEVDVRDYDGCLRLAHDPFIKGEDLNEFLAGYRHAGIIFNTKCDGLESEIIGLARKHSIQNYWFLDTALPTLVQLAKAGIRQTAVRYSEYEPLEAVLPFAGLVEWVWVDCFTRLPLNPDVWKQLRRNFKICIVSPELQRHGRAQIGAWRSHLMNMPVDGVCTDFPEDWASRISVINEGEVSDVLAREAA